MSFLSIPIPRGVWYVSEQPSPTALKDEKILSAKEVSGYRQSMPPGDAIQKRLSPISENARNRVWTSRELGVYSNSEFVYAICPIAIALVWGKGGRRIVDSESLSMISTILTHCLNTTAISN